MRVRVIFKKLGLISSSRFLSYTSHESGKTCELRDNTTHSKGLITGWPGLSGLLALTFNPVLHEPGQPEGAIFI